MGRPGLLGAVCGNRVRAARRLLVAGAVWFAPAGLSATDAARPAPNRGPIESGLLTDCQLGVFARRALQQDPQLAPLNLGVSVLDRTATIWGAIPSAELAGRATELVRRVPGVAAVHSDLSVEGPDPLTKERLVRSFSPVPARPPSVPSLTGLPAWGPPGGTAPAPAPAVVVTLRPPIPSEQTGPASPAPAVPVKTGDLLAAVERARAADPRFCQVRVEVREGVVVLRGIGARGQDLFELAQAASRVPGVRRVVVDQADPDRRAPLALP
jgi:hypothetical protein